MNLGSFAGGVAQGYQAGTRLKMAKQEMEDTRNFRERTAKMAEEKQDWERQDREAAANLKAEYDTLYKSFYPEGSSFGQDAAADMRFTAASFGLGLRNGKVDPKELLQYKQELTKLEQSEEGRQFMQALSAGQGSQEFQQLAGKFGLNGQAAKFDPKNMVLTDGQQTIDVRFPMMALGMKEYLTMLEATRKGDRDVEMHSADLAYKRAATGAQTASAGASGALARLRDAQRGNLGATKPADVTRLARDVDAALNGIDSFKMMRNMPTGSPAPTIRNLAIALAPKAGSPGAAADTAMDLYNRAVQMEMQRNPGIKMSQAQAIALQRINQQLAGQAQQQQAAAVSEDEE